MSNSHLLIRCKTTHKLILAIHLTPMQLMALSPYLPDEADAAQVIPIYPLMDTCDLFVEGDTASP